MLDLHLYGLIGYPLKTSFSPDFFSKKFEREGISDAAYRLFPLEDIRTFSDLLASQPDLRGLNVTIPYKKAVIPYLDELDETARTVGAVNTIRIRNGHLTGFNTDIHGFERSMLHLDGGRWLQSASGNYALILGTGGAAKAVAFVLQKYNIRYWLVSRNPESPEHLSYADLEQLDFSRIRWIFNTTPLGMYPEVDNCPDLPFDQLHSAQLVYDLVYNPAETLLLQRAKKRGATVKNGLEMLHLQAEAAWSVWQAPDTPNEPFFP